MILFFPKSLSPSRSRPLSLSLSLSLSPSRQGWAARGAQARRRGAAVLRGGPQRPAAAAAAAAACCRCSSGRRGGEAARRRRGRRRRAAHQRMRSMIDLEGEGELLGRILFQIPPLFVFWTNLGIQWNCWFQFFPMNTIDYCFETLISESLKPIMSGNSFQVFASIDTPPKLHELIMISTMGCHYFEDIGCHFLEGYSTLTQKFYSLSFQYC